MLEPSANHAMRLSEAYRRDVAAAVQAEALGRGLPAGPDLIERLVGKARMLLAHYEARRDNRRIAARTVALREA